MNPICPRSPIHGALQAEEVMSPRRFLASTSLWAVDLFCLYCGYREVGVDENGTILVFRRARLTRSFAL